MHRELKILSEIRWTFLFLALFCICILACIYRDTVRMIGVWSERMLPFVFLPSLVFIDLGGFVMLWIGYFIVTF